MAVKNSLLVVGATAMRDAITQLQMYSAPTDADGLLNAIGPKVAAAGTVDNLGRITFSDVGFTGLGFEQAVHSVGFWSGTTTFHGTSRVTGDGASNSSGEYRLDSLMVNLAAVEPPVVTA